MFMPSNHFSSRQFLMLLAGILFFFNGASNLNAEIRLFSFTTSTGLPIKVLQDSEMPFIHAELLIFLEDNTRNYVSLAISQLTVMNMFARELNSPSSNLLDSLFRLGNDYQVEQTPEYVKISLNFIPDRLASFTKLLNEIFTYQSFHLKKFNQSKENFWSFFTKNRDWKKEIAFLLAYKQIIGNFFFSQGVLVHEYFNNINLAQLRSFHLKTFRVDNALLILKGKINPYIALGMIEKDLPPGSKSAAKNKKEEIIVNPSRKIIVLNNNAADPPMIYWFDVAPAATDDDYLPFFIGNFTLFGFPGGRIYQSERNQLLMGGYKVNTEIYSLKSFTVFCNYLRLNYGDVENFLLLVDQERKKFSAQPIARKEYLDALNYYLGWSQVSTGHFDNGVQQVIDLFQSQPSNLLPLRSAPDLMREVNFDRVVQVLDDLIGYKHKAGIRERGVIVLIGNANQIINNFKILKADVVELFNN
jgi:predicted Zn-dependent peptidase